MGVEEEVLGSRRDVMGVHDAVTVGEEHVYINRAEITGKLAEFLWVYPEFSGYPELLRRRLFWTVSLHWICRLR
jgi:hypothetical protein